MKGRVKFFDDKKGYGFIESEERKDYFVHFSEIISDQKRKSLEKGDCVEFEINDQPIGPNAINVKKL